MSWCDLDLAFEISDRNLLKFCSGYIAETGKCRKLILGRDIVQGL